MVGCLINYRDYFTYAFEESLYQLKSKREAYSIQPIA